MVAAATRYAAEDDTPQAKRARLSASYVDGSAECECKSSTSGVLKAVCKVSDGTTDNMAGTKSDLATGVGFMDHMVDQLTAHAQVVVSLHVWRDGAPYAQHSNEAKSLSIDDSLQWADLLGRTLGSAVRSLIQGRLPPRGSAAVDSRFLCPLDEALSEVKLVAAAEPMSEPVVELEPFGSFPTGGRPFIGGLRTALVKPFFEALAKALGLGFTARRLRGDNAHHIVEATFKSFARSLRKVMDKMSGFSLDALDLRSLGVIQAVREGTLERSTRETGIKVVMALDPMPGRSPGEIDTGLKSLDQLLHEMVAASGMFLLATCRGDLWIDDHHSAEDTMIALGKVLAQALGDKAGVARMGCAEEVHGSARVLCVMDLSNRPSFHSDIKLESTDTDMLGDLSVEMLYHCFESLTFNAQITVHMVQLEHAGGTPGSMDLGMAMARSFGRALRECALVDPRRAGVTASSKGTLSK